LFDNKQHLTTETVAELLGISSKAVSLWLENGVLVEKYADNQVKVLEESVQKILNVKARLKNLKINASQHSLRILIVEDDEDLSRLLQIAITDFDFPVDIQTASDGMEGLMMTSYYKPEIIVADINMPVIDGITMINSIIGTEFEPKKFIVASALNAADILFKGGLPNIVQLIFKPYDLDVLKKLLTP
jgi:response regulator of citrate/malate metabolism